MNRDRRGHARAAIDGELAVGKVGQRLVPGCVPRSRDPPRDLVDRVLLAAEAGRDARVDDDELLAALEDLVRADRVARPLAGDEERRLDLFLACAERAAPALDPAEQDRALVMSEVAQQPPEPFRTAAVSVGDDEDALLDSGPRGGGRELHRARERVPAGASNREVGQLFVDVEERRARDVARPVEVTTTARVAELPAAIDELPPHAWAASLVARKRRIPRIA